MVFERAWSGRGASCNFQQGLCQELSVHGDLRPRLRPGSFLDLDLDLVLDLVTALFTMMGLRLGLGLLSTLMKPSGTRLFSECRYSDYRFP
jgi:hypothetical protein